MSEYSNERKKEHVTIADDDDHLYTDVTIVLPAPRSPFIPTLILPIIEKG